MVDRTSETYAAALLVGRRWRNQGIGQSDALARIVSEATAGADQSRIAGLTDGYASQLGESYGPFAVRPAATQGFDGPVDGFGVFVGAELVAWYSTVTAANRAAQSLLTGREPR